MKITYQIIVGENASILTSNVNHLINTETTSLTGVTQPLWEIDGPIVSHNGMLCQRMKLTPIGRRVKYGESK